MSASVIDLTGDDDDGQDDIVFVRVVHSVSTPPALPPERDVAALGTRDFHARFWGAKSFNAPLKHRPEVPARLQLDASA